MAHFLAERYISAGYEAKLAADAAVLSENGGTARLLLTLYLPGDESCLHTRFECALVNHKAAHRPPKPWFSSCSSPERYTHLAHGSYTFYVRARNGAGADPTPAKASFTI